MVSLNSEPFSLVPHSKDWRNPLQPVTSTCSSATRAAQERSVVSRVEIAMLNKKCLHWRMAHGWSTTVFFVLSLDLSGECKTQGRPCDVSGYCRALVLYRSVYMCVNIQLHAWGFLLLCVFLSLPWCWVTLWCYMKFFPIPGPPRANVKTNHWDLT